MASAAPARAPDAEREWPSLKHANYLLDARFAVEKRPYVAPFAKTYKKGILSALAQVWAEELTQVRPLPLDDAHADDRFDAGSHPGSRSSRRASWWSGTARHSSGRSVPRHPPLPTRPVGGLEMLEVGTT